MQGSWVPKREWYWGSIYPPVEMWSLTLIRIGRSVEVLPSQGRKGLTSWRQSLLRSTATLTLAQLTWGGWKISSPVSYPQGESSWPVGSENLNGLLSDLIRESVRLKEACPVKDMVVTMLGEATKVCVAGLALLCLVKLLFYNIITAQKKHGCVDLKRRFCTGVRFTLLNVLPVQVYQH